MAVLLVLLAPVACGSSSEDEPLPLAKPSETIEEHTANPNNSVVITIGNLTDKTGPGANAIAQVDMALDDLAAYYSEENLIPGVKFEVITYDGQFDYAKDIPGYEWLKERGADLIFSPIPSPPINLKSRLEEDKMVLFAVAAIEEAFAPPGYVFSPGNTLVKNATYTLIKRIAENDPDFPQDRPARIGGAYWIDAYGEEQFEAAEHYAEVHPDQYEWEGGYFTEFSFTWGPEVEALKDCDYILPNPMMNQFVEEYRSAGYTGKMIGTDAQLAFFGMIDEADLWDEVDGTLFVRGSRWWNEDNEITHLTKQLLEKNHPDEAEAIIKSGSGYLTIRQFLVMFELIAETVDAVGVENFTSQALYDVAQDFTLTIDGIESDSYNETKRTSANYMGIYEVISADEDLLGVSPEWIPVVSEP